MLFKNLNFDGLGLHNQINKNISAALASFIHIFCYFKSNKYIKDSNNYLQDIGSNLFNNFFQLVNYQSAHPIPDDFDITFIYNFIYNDQLSDIINDDFNIITNFLSKTIRDKDLRNMSNSIQHDRLRLRKFNSNKSSFITRIFKILPINPLYRINNSTLS
jgi:hypothetical protein